MNKRNTYSTEGVKIGKNLRNIYEHRKQLISILPCLSASPWHLASYYENICSDPAEAIFTFWQGEFQQVVQLEVV